MSTIYDVAKAASVSIATVSKVINNKEGISDLTRKKVKNIIKELNYTPSSAAQSLSANQHKMIGLIIPFTSNPYYGRIAYEIEQFVRLFGYNLTICCSNTYTGAMTKSINTLIETGVDGIILASFASHEKTKETLEKLSLPIVLFATRKSSLPYTCVNIDEYATTKSIVRDVIDLGYKEILLATQSPVENSSFIEAYTEMMEDAQLQPQIYIHPNQEALLIFEIDSTKIGNPEAIICCDEVLAISILKGMQSTIKETSILTFAGTDLPEVTTPELTTIKKPIAKMAEEVVRRLIEQIQNKTIEDIRIIFPTEINYTESLTRRLER